MTSRHPIGGGIRSASDRTRGRGVLLMLGACIALPLLFAGCSGDWDDHDHFYDDYEPEPIYHNVTFILNVSDLDGDALGLATVWIDGVARREKTSWEFVRLGNDYPESWRGFEANWILGGFTVATYGWDDVVDVEVMVTKAGFQSQATTFEITGSLPVDVYARETFALEPSIGPASADADKPIHKTKPGEVIGWTKPETTATSQVPTMYKLASEAALERRDDWAS